MPPLSRISWSWFTGMKNDGYDLHVIRGKPSPSLANDVVYVEVVDEFSFTSYPVNHPKSIAEIKPNSLDFKPLAWTTTDDATSRSAFGIKIDKATGVITAGAPSGGVTVHNFLLGASATLIDGTTVIGPVLVRVHIHDRVKRCWLTPSPLTIYRGSPKQRFTLLAEMETDGQPDPPMVCDLSRLPGVTWVATPSTGITMGTDGEIGTKLATATTPETPLGTIAITATLPADYGSKQALAAAAEVVLGFDEQPQAHYRASLRSGPGSARLAEVPNILLLSEGFQAEQESDWDTLVGTLVDDLAHSAAFRPFDLFVSKNSVNIWSLFLPSRERGSSALHDLHPKAGQSTWPASGEGIPRSRHNPNRLDIASACFHFGLPVRSDTMPADPAAQKDAAKTKVGEWSKLTGWNLDPNNAGLFALWQTWAGFANRTLADERDTLLGLAFGTRPNVHSDSVDRGADYHPFRARRSELDKLLAKVTDGDGPIIGHVWVPRPDGSSRTEAGKDRSLVVALIGGGRQGGLESSRSVTAASIHSEGELPLSPVDNPASSLRVQILPHDIPKSTLWGSPRVGAAQLGTIVHELGHAFGVGDEYVEADYFGKIPKGNGNGGFANLTLESELVTATSVVGDKLTGDKLRWQWPRITNAAVLGASPWLSGSNASTGIVIPFQRLGDKFMFKNGDVVFLRRRPLRGTVDKIHVEAKPSTALVVTSDNQDGNQIVVRTQDGSDLKVADFPAPPGMEPILFFAVPPPAYAAARQEKFASMTPLVVRDHITSTGLPLNRKDAGKCDSMDDIKRAQLVNVPADVDPFWIVGRQWVGAFDGGAQYPCGIFHPTPDCIMRQSFASAMFCPVCRYILVDAVDPSLHGAIETEYAPGYVEPNTPTP